MHFQPLEKALADPEITVVAQIAPAVRVSLGELFGYAPGTPLTKKVVGALKQLGFDFVFDTSLGADVAVVEAGFEFKERLEKGGLFPVINSCCPGTVLFLEHAYPDLVPHVASVKSPMEITAVLAKTYFAQKKKLDADKIFSVAVMPCVIKKSEALRREMRVDGRQMVDLVLTTVELAEFMGRKGVDLRSCEEKDFDSLLGTASGAGQIFGSTGGVSEAAIRHFASTQNFKIEKTVVDSLRAPDGLRETVFNVGGKQIKVLVINCLRNASVVLNDKQKFSQYHFIEIMACLGGCVGGAGQPTSTLENLEKRRSGLYSIDSATQLKAPMQSPDVQAVYKEFLGSPASEKSLALLHTTFSKICTDCF